MPAMRRRLSLPCEAARPAKTLHKSATYEGAAPFTDESRRILRVLIERAARAAERFDRRSCGPFRTGAARALPLLALSRGTLEELASDEADALLDRWLAWAVEQYRF